MRRDSLPPCRFADPHTFQLPLCVESWRKNARLRVLLPPRTARKARSRGLTVASSHCASLTVPPLTVSLSHSLLSLCLLSLSLSLTASSHCVSLTVSPSLCLLSLSLSLTASSHCVSSHCLSLSPPPLLCLPSLCLSHRLLSLCLPHCASPQIMDAGRMDVLAAIEYHGGVDRVAVFMGLRAPRRPQRHWCVFYYPTIVCGKGEGNVVRGSLLARLPVVVLRATAPFPVTAFLDDFLSQLASCPCSSGRELSFRLWPALHTRGWDSSHGPGDTRAPKNDDPTAMQKSRIVTFRVWRGATAHGA